MVKGKAMLISEFALRTGLSRDTVRFYVRLGLFQPATGVLGGRNAYQVFTEEHVQMSDVIRISQSLGMSLKEIAALGQARRDGRASAERSTEVLVAQLRLLEERGRKIAAMTGYLRAKIAWLQEGERGVPPDFSVLTAAGSPSMEGAPQTSRAAPPRSTTGASRRTATGTPGRD